MERPKSWLEDKCPLLQQIYLDNTAGIAIYSVPESILLKANQHYLDFLPEPYNKIENAIGLRIDEFMGERNESTIKSAWSQVFRKMQKGMK